MVFRQHQFRVVLKNTGIGCVQVHIEQGDGVRENRERSLGWHREESEASPDKFTQESCDHTCRHVIVNTV